MFCHDTGLSSRRLRLGVKLGCGAQIADMVAGPDETWTFHSGFHRLDALSQLLDLRSQLVELLGLLRMLRSHLRMCWRLQLMNQQRLPSVQICHAKGLRSKIG